MDKNSILQILGYGLVLPGAFLFLLGLFSGPIQTGDIGRFESWTNLVSFYSGIEFMIGGFVLVSVAHGAMPERRMGASPVAEERKLSGRLSRFPIDLGIALMVGVVISAANTFVVWDRFASSSGFPFQVKSPYPGCFGPFWASASPSTQGRYCWMVSSGPSSLSS